jgi:hypothetical protein
MHLAAEYTEHSNMTTVVMMSFLTFHAHVLSVLSPNRKPPDIANLNGIFNMLTSM